MSTYWSGQVEASKFANFDVDDSDEEESDDEEAREALSRLSTSKNSRLVKSDEPSK